MTIQVDPKKAAFLLFIITLALLFMNIAGLVIGILLERNSGSAFLELVQKQSALRLFTTSLLLLCSGIFLVISIVKKKVISGGNYHWLGLCILFGLMAIAKDTYIDEQIAELLRSTLNISKSVIYSVVYGFGFIFLPILYLKFLLQLPRRTLNWFITGSATFLTGAFVLDLVTAYLGKILIHRTIAYIGVSSLEVLFEICGIIIVIYTFLSYLYNEMNTEKVGFLNE